MNEKAYKATTPMIFVANASNTITNIQTHTYNFNGARKLWYICRDWFEGLISLMRLNAFQENAFTSGLIPNGFIKISLLASLFLPRAPHFFLVSVLYLDVRFSN